MLICRADEKGVNAVQVVYRIIMLALERKEIKVSSLKLLEILKKNTSGNNYMWVDINVGSYGSNNSA